MERTAQLIKNDILLFLVHRLDSLDHTHVIIVLYSRMQQRLHVFRETRASITATGVQEAAANTGIRSHALTDIIHVGSHTLAKVGDIVHETDTGSQHGIGGILGHLGGGDIHHQDWIAVQGERPV